MDLHYRTPTRYDQAKFGIRWTVMNDAAKEVYIQLNHDPENPRWEKMSFMLDKALERYYEDDNFVIEMLKMYEGERVNFFENTL